MHKRGVRQERGAHTYIIYSCVRECARDFYFGKEGSEWGTAVWFFGENFKKIGENF